MSDAFVSDVGGSTGLESGFDDAQTFTFYEGQEAGDPSDWIYNQEGYMEATVEDLEEYYNSATNLQNTFGSFDNYLAYMTEREQLIQDGLYDPGSYGSVVDTGMVQNVDGTMIDPADIQNLSPNDFIAKYGLDKSEVQIVEQETMSGRRSGYSNWLNSEAVQELNAKYGIANELQTDDGRRYLWNGSAWVKSFEPENQYDFGNIMKGVTAAGMAAIIGPAVAGVLAPTMGAVAANAAASTLVNSALTLAQGESLSLTDALTEAAMSAGLGWALEEMGGALAQVGEFESTISPELQNSLDILRESNPEKYLEALEILDAAAQQGSGWSQVLGDLADIGVSVGNIVWDANQNDGGDAAQPTVNDNGDYVFDGGDVSVNVPNYQNPDDTEDGGGGGGGGSESGGGDSTDGGDASGGSTETGGGDTETGGSTETDVGGNDDTNDGYIVERQIHEAILDAQEAGDDELADALIVEWERITGREWTPDAGDSTNSGQDPNQTQEPTGWVWDPIEGEWDPIYDPDYTDPGDGTYQQGNTAPTSPPDQTGTASGDGGATTTEEVEDLLGNILRGLNTDDSTNTTNPLDPDDVDDTTNTNTSNGDGGATSNVSDLLGGMRDQVTGDNGGGDTNTNNGGGDNTDTGGGGNQNSSAGDGGGTAGVGGLLGNILGGVQGAGGGGTGGSTGGNNGGGGLGMGLLAGLGGGGTGENYRWQPIAGPTKMTPYQKRRHAIYSSLNDGLLAAAMKPSGGIL